MNPAQQMPNMYVRIQAEKVVPYHPPSQTESYDALRETELLTHNKIPSTGPYVLDPITDFIEYELAN